ncbi:MAG: hypothetical protein M1814_003927 [Vezdaea aestivalis]|nr:MAG: hypothetical protein M1814_003927 [Vezdaea aestivalis]
MDRLNKKRQRGAYESSEIKFDSSARANYLTGFHKRKVQRTKQAQEHAEGVARAQRIEIRKSLRNSRKEDLDKHVEAVNSMIRKLDNPAGEDVDSSGRDSSPWEGFGEVGKDEAQREDNFLDEGRLTSVTIEAIDITKDGFQNRADGRETDNTAKSQVDCVSETSQKQRKSDRPSKRKKKKNPFRYESKVERKATRLKQVAGARARANKRKE